MPKFNKSTWCDKIYKEGFITKDDLLSIKRLEQGIIDHIFGDQKETKLNPKKGVKL